VKPGGILALDLSTHVGWAYGSPGQNEPPIGGVIHLPPMRMDDLGRLFAALDNELEDAIALHQPALVVQEAALVIADGSARMLIGLSAHVESNCYRNSVRCKSVSVDHARSFVLGRARFPTGTTKTYVIQWARSQGYEPKDDNHADALLMWRYACARIPLPGAHLRAVA
jgi:hypothetical protein